MANTPEEIPELPTMDEGGTMQIILPDRAFHIIEDERLGIDRNAEVTANGEQTAAVFLLQMSKHPIDLLSGTLMGGKYD